MLLAFPFEITLFGASVRIPDWVKGVFGLSLPIMANISEVVRGAVLSVPTAQWEAAEEPRLLAPADPVAGHPAAMLQAHAGRRG